MAALAAKYLCLRFGHEIDGRNGEKTFLLGDNEYDLFGSMAAMAAKHLRLERY